MTTGLGNTAQGYGALYKNATGSHNVAIGNIAGFSNETGGGNVFVGWKAGYNETGHNRLYIASNPTTPLLFGVFNELPEKNKLGIGTQTVAANQAINVWNGAHLTKGGVWTNASSRELKDNIEPLSTADANAALESLSPVRYVYKNSRDDVYVGFIAEDMPELVASQDHKSLSPMDIVAVLTTVTKDHAAKMTVKDVEISALRDSLTRQESVNQNQEERLLQVEMTLAEVLRNQSSEAQVSLTN